MAHLIRVPSRDVTLIENSDWTQTHMYGAQINTRICMLWANRAAHILVYLRLCLSLRLCVDFPLPFSWANAPPLPPGFCRRTSGIHFRMTWKFCGFSLCGYPRAQTANVKLMAFRNLWMQCAQLCRSMGSWVYVVLW